MAGHPELSRILLVVGTVGYVVCFVVASVVVVVGGFRFGFRFVPVGQACFF